MKWKTEKGIYLRISYILRWNPVRLIYPTVEQNLWNESEFKQIVTAE